MKLRTIGLAALAALALAGSAQAQEAGWDTKYGVLFTVPNPFGGGSGTNVLSDFGGKVGVQANLAPERAFRLAFDLYRQSEGIIETRSNGVTTKTVPTWTSNYFAAISGEYMIRMGTAAVAPYVGVGGQLNFAMDRRDGTASVSTAPLLDTKYDRTDKTFGLVALGTLGLEWRVHKVISLFVEYEADLTLVSMTTSDNKVTSSGVVTTDTSSDEKHFLNLSTGIAQGGRIGLLAFF